MADLAEGQSIYDYEAAAPPFTGILLGLVAVLPFWIAAAWLSL